MWRIEYNEVAQADVLALDKGVRKRILGFFHERVANHPDPAKRAQPLERQFRGLHRFKLALRLQARTLSNCETLIVAMH